MDEPNGQEVIRLLRLIAKQMRLHRHGATPALDIGIVTEGHTIEPGVRDEYEIVLNKTVYIGSDENEHIVYTINELSGDRDTPPDADMVEHGRFKSAGLAARRAMLVWCEILVDGILERDQEDRLVAELDALAERPAFRK